MCSVARWSCLATCLALVPGCALGEDGVVPRDRDGSTPMDGGPGTDGSLGRDGSPGTDSMVPPGTDMDGDGVPSERDCNDADPAVGSMAERGCSSMCGTGIERCTDGRWEICTAPLTCDCAAGSPPRTLDCGRCGSQRQVCTDGAWVDDGACTGEGPCTLGDIDMGPLCGRCGREERRCQTDCTWGPTACVAEGVCMAGATDTGTRACTTTCGDTQTRTRSCGATCTWGTWSGWSACPPCGPVCGDGTCDGGETCMSCADCRYGHLGTGENGDPCPGAAEGIWRCVTRAGGSRVSQVCRSGGWISFNLTPRDCSACMCAFSLACCQVGSPSSGC